MASISAGVLCDYAQVRENLLFVMSGGISRVVHPTLPAPLGLMLGLLVDVPADELDQVHELSVVVKQPDTAKDVARWAAALQTGGDTFPGENILAAVTVDMRQVPIDAYGSYDVQAAIDGQLGVHLTFYVTDRKPGG